MSHERKEKDRAARAKARAQMGTRLGRREPQQVDGIFPAPGNDAWDEWAHWPHLICGCGEEVESVAAVLLCPEGHKAEG